MDRDEDRFERPEPDDEARFTHEADTEVARPRDPRTARPAPGDEPPHPRVSVVREPGDAEDDEYRWHTGHNRPTGSA